MKVSLRLPRLLLKQIHEDLSRPHAFAYERVGFIACNVSELTDGFLLLGNDYKPVQDDHYVDDPNYGALMGPNAIRTALQYAYKHDVSMVHVHRHEHHGRPGFSRTDISENAKFVPDFFKVRPTRPHGAIVLSHDAVVGEAFEPGTINRRPMDQISIVGRPLFSWWSR